MNHPATEHDDFPAMTIQEHLLDLLTRLRLVFGIPLLTALFGSFFVPLTILPYLHLITLSDPTPSDISSPPPLERLLWGALSASLALHYLLLFHVLPWVTEGLYPAERRAIRVPVYWAYAMPVVTLCLMLALAYLGRFLSIDLLADPPNVRAWFVRLYLTAGLIILLVSLPRRSRTLHPALFIIAFLGLYLLPHHTFDTLLLTLLEVSAVGFPLASLSIFCIRRSKRSVST